VSEQGADARQFEVQARLTKDAAMIGEWTSETTADKKLTERIRLYDRDTRHFDVAFRGLM
jgi:hypothetical protein